MDSRTFIKEDKVGNKLIAEAFLDNKEYTFATINLKLAKERRNRLLGMVDVQKATYHIVRNSARHYHYKSKSFGFNWEVLSGNLIHIETISLRLDNDRLYVFPKSLITEYGTFLNFKQQGFELQRFLRFDLIKRYEKIFEKPTEYEIQSKLIKKTKK